jgi:hypothetical protein
VPKLVTDNISGWEKFWGKFRKFDESKSRVAMEK